MPRRSSVAAGEGAHLVLYFNTNTTIWISPCRWKKLADGLGGKLAFSPLRNRRSRFASERGRIKNIRGRCAVENPAPHRTTASGIFYSLSFSRTERRRTRGAPVGSRRPFSSIGLLPAAAACRLLTAKPLFLIPLARASRASLVAIAARPKRGLGARNTPESQISSSARDNELKLAEVAHRAALSTARPRAPF